MTVEAIVRAAQRGIDEHGLDVTVDTIAELADVGRRTVFRYFATRDDLLSDAIAASFTAVFESIPGYCGGDWEVWLDALAQFMHASSADIGRRIWELKTRRLPPRLQVTYQQHREALQGLFVATATTLWEAAGGPGMPPDLLRHSVAAHLSPLFTQAVLLDADGSPELAGQLAAGAITATVRELLGHAEAESDTSAPRRRTRRQRD